VQPHNEQAARTIPASAATWITAAPKCVSRLSEAHDDLLRHASTILYCNA